jgi:hypothetical protein
MGEIPDRYQEAKEFVNFGIRLSFSSTSLVSIIGSCNNTRCNYSVLRLFTGFVVAAFRACKLTVNSAIHIAIKPEIGNTHQ